MPNLLVAGRLHPDGMALMETLPERGWSYDYVEEISLDSMIPMLSRADAVILRTQPMSRETIALAPQLKVVSRHGVGYDAVDVEALNERGIGLTIVGDVNSVSAAEQAMALMLAAAKRVIRGDKAVRDPSKWNWRNRLEQVELHGKNLLIIGYGRIGRRLAQMASGFSMNIHAYDPMLAASGWPEGDVAPVNDLHTALAWADVVSVHVPKTDGALIGAAELAQMKPGAILVNTARGGVVDEAALAQALQTGQIGAAGFDVFESEPFDPASPLAGLDQVVMSPHIAGISEESAARMAVQSIENAVDYVNGTIDRAMVVNADVVLG